MTFARFLPIEAPCPTCGQLTDTARQIIIPGAVTPLYGGGLVLYNPDEPAGFELPCGHVAAGCMWERVGDGFVARWTVGDRE